jgi:MoxR-like ATPase
MAGTARDRARRDARLPEPFYVLATQNPIELEGTYPLPEAQLDRFLFKLDVRASTARR